MPRNPKVPPYKSKYVVSKSVETAKYMTTVPKPVANTIWNLWSVEKTQENTLIWSPTNYDHILKHLTDTWKFIYSEEFKRIKQNERYSLFVVYDTHFNIMEVDGWKIVSKEIPLEEKRFKWTYNTKKTEYLINILTYDLKKNLLEAQFGPNYTVEDEEELDVLYATVSLDLAKINPNYWASLLKMKEIIETAVLAIIGNTWK